MPVRVLRVGEFCRVYAVSRATAYRLMASGSVPYRELGNRARLIPVEAAERWFTGLPGKI
jgi:hypothetical protein